MYKYRLIKIGRVNAFFLVNDLDELFELSVTFCCLLAGNECPMQQFYYNRN